MSILTDAELADGAARQESAWRVRRSAQRDALADLPEDQDVADHHSDLTGRQLVPIMMHPDLPQDSTPRRPPHPIPHPIPHHRLDAAPLGDYRARCLLALSLLNHRTGTDGLGPVDVEVVRAVLNGRPVGAA